MGAELREQVAALKNEVSELRSKLKTKSAIAEWKCGSIRSKSGQRARR